MKIAGYPLTLFYGTGNEGLSVFAEVVELVDTHVSGACGASYAGSSPAFGTNLLVQSTYNPMISADLPSLLSSFK